MIKIKSCLIATTLLAYFGYLETSSLIAETYPKEARNALFDFTKAGDISSGDRKMLIDIEREGGSEHWLSRVREENLLIEHCPPGFRCCITVWLLINVDTIPDTTPEERESGRNRYMEILRKLAETGYTPAYPYLADFYDQQGEQSKALYWYTSAAELGCESSMSQLSVKYAQGKGVLKDYVEAIKWTLLAAAKGDIASKNKINSFSQSTKNSNEFIEAHRRASLWQNNHPKAFMTP